MNNDAKEFKRQICWRRVQEFRARQVEKSTKVKEALKSWNLPNTLIFMLYIRVQQHKLAAEMAEFLSQGLLDATCVPPIGL